MCSGQFDMTELHGGSPWGASTFAGADGSRQPSKMEMNIAKKQGKATGQFNLWCGYFLMFFVHFWVERSESRDFFRGFLSSIWAVCRSLQRRSSRCAMQPVGKEPHLFDYV